MSTVVDHYEQLLARCYTWTFGTEFELKVAEQKRILIDAGFQPGGLAIDLGCGPGFQSIALADLGADMVCAIDLSAALLAELAAHVEGRAITTFRSDLTKFRQVVGAPANTIVCMGDTLTHLASENQVSVLLADVAASLIPGGLFILSWRDLSDLAVGNHFIPVRSDHERVFLCCLESGPKRVFVHDLVYEQRPDGWTFQKGSYPKLKISRSALKQMLTACGLALRYERADRGMTILAAHRPTEPQQGEAITA